ncbi:MAG TPA: hypothetical protein VMU77_04375, partial [Acidimicrobiales bacterium]|nr:hypothetical protein [Acidimicrobiales bacterium]
MELHELSNTMTGALLSYVGREGGTDKIEAILELAGERRSIAELCDPTKWGSYDQAHALFTAAVLVMNDPDIGRAAGKELVRSNFSGLGTFLSSLKGPAEVIELVSEIGAKSSTVTDIEAVEVTADSALVSARTKSPITRDKIFCSYTAGVLSLLPQLFGMDCAEVTEIKCQARGDMRCLYKVTWDPSTDPEKSPERHIAYLKSQISALTDRMESLETIAADLVSE